MADDLSSRSDVGSEPASISSVEPLPVVKQPFTVEFVPRRLKIHQVSENEFDTIASHSNSTNLSFFSLCVGLLIAFWIVLDGGGLDEKKRSIYGMLTLGSAILAAYFLVATVFDRIKWHRTIRALKRGITLK